MEAFVVFRKNEKIVAVVSIVEAELLAKQKNLYDAMYWCVPEKIEFVDGGFHYTNER